MTIRLTTLSTLLLTVMAFLTGTVAASARQNVPPAYDIEIAGQADGGRYLVRVTTVLDKNQKNDAREWLRRLAVDGVMFHGLAPAGGYSAQAPLIADPLVRSQKAEFFTAFNNEKLYNNYADLENSSIIMTKLPKKKWEVSALITVDKENLLHFLNEHGIVEGFGNLW
ncbi:MAG: hypothetical protein J6C67_05095 [Muribaculaceae bacterium]|nr:hypothetical protein [Muribaculaceae bacterium]